MNQIRKYCRSVARFVRSPFFVKVGSHDGIKGDPCGDELLRGTKWRGLLIEPVPYLSQRARATYSDRQRFSHEQVAVSSKSGTAAFYHLGEEARTRAGGLPTWFDQLGSFDKAHIIKCLGEGVESLIEQTSVEVKTLSELLRARQIKKVHLLQIDTEGHDLDVLTGLDFEELVPAAVFIEHKHLGEVHKAELRDLLARQGYSVFDEGGDYFAVHAESCRRMRRTSFFGLLPVDDT